MDCSIVILNYRTPGLLRVSLRGLATAKLSIHYEIIVVDNASGDTSVDVVRHEFPNVNLIVSPVNGGFAAGNNLGLRAARGEFVIIMNPDLAVFPGVIENLVDYMRQHKEVGLLAPQLRSPDGTVQVSAYRFPSLGIAMLRRTPLGKLPWGRRKLRSYLMLDADLTSTHAVDWVLGGCMVVRRSALERVGLLDERFFMYVEDVDWCRRFWEAGFPVVFHPSVSLVHYHQRQSAESPGLTGVFSRLTRVHIASWVKYFWKYHHSPIPHLPPHD